MSRSHLIPTTITNVKGVQTTVYRRPDGGSGKVSAALKTPPKQAGSMEKLKAEVSTALFDPSFNDIDMGRLRKQTENVLDNATANQLRNINDALEIIREREPEQENLNVEVRRLKSLVRTGAHSTIAIAVQRYDEAPEGKSLCTFAVKQTAQELMSVMRPVAMDDNKKLLKSLSKTSPDKIEFLRRAVYKAHAIDGGSGGMYLDSLESRLMGSDSESAYLYGMYADAIPDSMPPNRASRSIKQLFREKIVNIDGDNLKLAAHLEALTLFERIKIDTDAPDFYPGMGASYAESPKLIAGVNKYPDRISELMEYRKERQSEDFDSDHFREYLNAGVMKEGML